MAIQLSYSDTYGDLYASSYWRVAQVNMNVESKTGQITFNCYKDSASKGKRLIDSKSYTIIPAMFDSYFGVVPTDVSTASNASLSMAYRLAKETKDKDIGTPLIPNMVSFFNGGIDV